MSCGHPHETPCSDVHDLLDAVDASGSDADDIPDLVQEDVCDLGLVGLNVLEERQLELAARGALRSIRGKKSAIQFFQNLGTLTAGGSANLNEALRRGALEARQAGVAAAATATAVAEIATRNRAARSPPGPRPASRR